MNVTEALAMYEAYKTYWSENYNEARTDLNFAIGRDHWDSGDIEIRRKAGKVSLVINQLPQFIHQVTNDIRQNTPSVKVIPEADGDIDTAEVWSGLIRGIEYKSGADECYDTAAEYAVKCGIGFIMVDHDYVEDEGEEQELCIRRVPDPLSVYIDPASVECDGRDANGAIRLEPITEAEFKRLYPGKKFVSFTDPKDQTAKDTIVLGQIFVREWGGNRGKKATIRRYRFSGDALLAETVFPGKYIPIVPVFGEETWVNGKRHIASLIRQARDPQKRLNHWASKEAELLAMAPIAPVMAVEGTLANERGQWQRPGSEMVLEYRQTDLEGNQAPAPQRLAPPPIPTGIINAMEGAKQNIKESMGMYNASLGEKSNEKSGVAIQARKQEGDVATFHFPDNVRRAINQVGRVILEAAPSIYDTPRSVQVVDEEGEVKNIGVNGAPLADKQKRAFDLTKGKYHVRITTGASYTTKREEEAEFLAQIAQKDPNFMGIGGDLLFKSLDTPGAQALAARYRKMIPPALLEDNEEIDPKVIQLTEALQQAQAQLQQMAMALQEAQAAAQSNAMKVEADMAKAEVDKMKIQVEQQKLVVEALKLKIEEQKLMNPQAEQPAQPQAQAPMSLPPIKLDTTGFQFSKTPEQEAMEAEQQQLALQLDMEERAKEEEEKAAEMQIEQVKIQQADAVLNTLAVIADQLAAIANRPTPTQVVRDENGMVVGVQ